MAGTAGRGGEGRGGARQVADEQGVIRGQGRGGEGEGHPGQHAPAAATFSDMGHADGERACLGVHGGRDTTAVLQLKRKKANKHKTKHNK